MGSNNRVSLADVQITYGFYRSRSISSELKLSAVTKSNGSRITDAVGVVRGVVEGEFAAVEGEAAGTGSAAVGSAEGQR